MKSGTLFFNDATVSSIAAISSGSSSFFPSGAAKTMLTSVDSAGFLVPGKFSCSISVACVEGTFLISKTSLKPFWNPRAAAAMPTNSSSQAAITRFLCR